MNIKLNVLSAAVLAVISTGAMAVPPQPLEVPPIYNAGPTSPLVASTDLSLAERQVYANYEAVMQIAEARIHASSCSNTAGNFAVTAKSDGAENSPATNYVKVTSPGGSYTVAATAAPPSLDGYGQTISVNSPAGIFNTKPFVDYHADVAYNGVNNMMDSTSYVSVLSINNKFDKYYGKVIKDFYRGSLNEDENEYYNIYDWGLQALDKLGYPVNKYWQRSKSHRDDGTIGRTVFVKDRLVGSTICRIIIDTSGSNNQDFFDQKGWLRIQTGILAAPGQPVPEFTQYPFL